MRKILYAVVGILALLLLTLVTLLFTHSGNVFLWNQATQRIDSFSGELVDGQLLSGWTMSNIHWQDDSIDFYAQTAHISWQLSDVLNRKLPVELVKVSNSHLHLLSNKLPSNKPPSSPIKVSSSNQPLDIPLDVIVKRIILSDFQFESLAAKVHIGLLITDAQLVHNALIIDQGIVDQLDIAISDSPPDNSPNNQPTVPKEAIPLPRVELPLPIQVGQFQFTNGVYQQGSTRELIKKLSLSFNWDKTNISKIQLSVDHALASASLNGNIDLSGSYPLNATIQADLHKPLLDGMLAGEHLSLTTSGDLMRLSLRLDGKGPVTASAKGIIEPLMPDIPFDLKLEWQALNWPFEAEPKQVLTKNGVLFLAGSLKEYKIKLDSSIEIPSQPVTQVQLIGSGDLNKLNIEQFLLKEPEGRLKLQGQFSWKDGVHWQGKTTLVNLNPGLWVPAVSGKLSGTIDSDFTFANNQWQVDIPTLSIKGMLREYPIHLTGKIAAKQADNSIIPVSLTVDKLDARVGQNILTANGKLSDKWKMKVRLNAQALSELYSGLQGAVQGDFDIGGNANRPSILYQLNSSQILYQQLNLSGLQVEGHLGSGELLGGKLLGGKLLGGETSITVSELVTDDLLLNNLKVQAKGNELKHQLSLSVEGKPVSGQVNLQGSWKNQQWQGQLLNAAVNTPLDVWFLDKPLSIMVDKHQRATLSDQCWVSDKTSLCIDATQLSAQKGAARFKLAEFDFQRLQTYFPENFSWQSVLSAQGQVQWQDNKPTISLQLKTTPGTLSAGDLSFNYSHLEVLLNFQEQRLSSSLLFQSNQLGVAKAEITVDDIQEQRKLSGNLTLAKLRLDFLTPFIPEVSTIDGTVSAQARLDGTLSKPLLFGDLTLDQGQLATRTEMVSINDLTTRLKIIGDYGVISGHMLVGEGRLDIGGNLNWQEMPPSGHIAIKGNDIQFQYPGILEVKVSPDLKFDLNQGMTLTGKIQIPWARIEVKDLPKSAVKVSEDAVVITNGKPEAEENKAPFNMQVEVILGDDITVNAYGLETNLGGHILLAQDPKTSLAGNGSIQLIEGRYRYLGQDLLIQEGNIIFSGPLKSPYLMIDAIRNPDTIVDDTQVGIKVNGTVTRPDWEVYSVPTMSQQEQLSYLLRGRGLENGDNSSLQSILLNVGVSQIGGVVSTVGEAIGFSDVTLDTEGSGDDTQVTIGGNIAPGLRLSYGAGVFSAVAEIKVRYELMPRLYLQAVSGLAQAVDIFYQFKIEGSK